MHDLNDQIFSTPIDLRRYRSPYDIAEMTQPIWNAVCEVLGSLGYDVRTECTFFVNEDRSVTILSLYDGPCFEVRVAKMLATPTLYRWPPDINGLPSADEAGVCVVARDMVLEGRIDEAIKALEEQAPNRLLRYCPVCTAKPGNRCAERNGVPASMDAFRASLDARTMEWFTPPTELIVPHHERLVAYSRGPGDELTKTPP